MSEDDSIIELSDTESSESSSDTSVIELISSDSDPEENPRNESAASELVFVDLKRYEVKEIKGHQEPNATAEELVTISDQFVNSLATKDNVLNYSNVTLRKRIKKPIEADVSSKPEIPPIQSTQIEGQEKSPEIRATKSFMESLDDKVPLEHAHPESVKFKKYFKRHRNELVEKLMCMYNEKIFENKICNLPWSWTKWIGDDSGCCHYRTWNGENYASISLNDLFVTTAERVRDDLLHEMCHAAVFIIDKQLNGHEELWQSWGQLAKKAFPEIPLIDRYHHYKITQKYKYKCTICSRSSLTNSKLKVDNIFCGFCRGPVELFRIQIKNGRRVTVALRKPGSFALFVKENYRLIKTPDITHAGVMKALSEKYSKLTVAQKQKYRQSFGGLK